MDKVKLPKKVVDAIQEIRERRGEDRTLFNYPNIALHAPKVKEYHIINAYINQSEDNFKKYFHALVNGYEVEASPEEKLKEQYDYYVEKGLHVSANAYIEVLKTLGLKIKGINY
jgi:hypothetical protein